MRARALENRIRCLLCTVLLSATIAACSDSSSGPEGGAWYDGTWSAVRANNLALPYRSDRGVLVRDLVVTLHADTTKPSSLYLNGSTTTLTGSVIDNTSTRIVTVTSTDQTVRVYALPTSTIGQLDVTFTRKGDTLVIPSYSGAEFKLVRR
jgi:hypothetical protein